MGVAEIAKTTGLARQTVYRIQKEPDRQAAALASWFPKDVAAQVMPSLAAILKRYLPDRTRLLVIPHDVNRSASV